MALFSLAQGDRCEDLSGNQDLADADARASHDAGERRGIGVHLLVQAWARGYAGLCRVFQNYADSVSTA